MKKILAFMMVALLLIPVMMVSAAEAGLTDLVVLADGVDLLEDGFDPLIKGYDVETFYDEVTLGLEYSESYIVKVNGELYTSDMSLGLSLGYNRFKITICESAQDGTNTGDQIDLYYLHIVRQSPILDVEIVPADDEEIETTDSDEADDSNVFYEFDPLNLELNVCVDEDLGAVIMSYALNEDWFEQMTEDDITVSINEVVVTTRDALTIELTELPMTIDLVAEFRDVVLTYSFYFTEEMIPDVESGMMIRWQHHSGTGQMSGIMSKKQERNLQDCPYYDGDCQEERRQVQNQEQEQEEKMNPDEQGGATVNNREETLMNLQQGEDNSQMGEKGNGSPGKRGN